jgi:hypothetical protein
MNYNITGCICTYSGFTGHSLTSIFWTYVKTVKPEWADLRIRNFLVRVKSPFPDPDTKLWVLDLQQCNWQLHCFSTAGASMCQIKLIQEQYLFWQLMHLVQLNCNGLLPTTSSMIFATVDCQLVSSCKRLATHCATVWLFTSVNCHMPVKMYVLWKRFATHCATVWLFTCVNFCMLIKVDPLFKGFATHCATVWLFTSVNSHMVVKMYVLWKRFATHCATVWLFTCVNCHMPVKMFA